MKKVKIVGTKTLIDPKTGEEITAVVEVVKGDRRYGWEAVWLSTLLETLELISNKAFKVAKFLLNERVKSENLIIATVEEIAKKTGVSETTVKRVIKKLLDANFITRVKRGVYRVNPAIIWRGYEDKRQAILIKFHDEQSKNKRKKKEKGNKSNKKKGETASVPEKIDLDPSTFEEIFTTPNPKKEVNDEQKA